MKRLVSAFALFLFSCCVAWTQDVKVSWQTDPVDGHRTGVVASTADNVPQAMGTMKGRTYISPSGKKFRRGTTAAVAKVMLDAQPAMARNKAVIGHSAKAMDRAYPESAFLDWFADELARAVQDSTGRKVHVAISNRGGVRSDMPKGDVLYDDIMSMFPFRNKICYVGLHGRDLRVILEQMARSHFQVISGVKVVAKDGKLVSATIDGEPLDDEKVYGVATIDFILDGGDGYHVAKNAVEVIKCKGYIYDTMLAYVSSLEAEGKQIEYEKQGWITLLGEGNIDED